MRKFNATQLKYIAIIAMTIDHIALAFISTDSTLYFIMRCIGKITAPLMCLFLTEGFRYTRNRKKYLMRLLMFALISQPFYYIFIFKRIPENIFSFITHLNVMFTFAIALISLSILENKKLNSIAKILLFVFVFSLGQICDWSYMIPIWTLIFYYTYKNKMRMNILFILVSLLLLPLLYLKEFDSFIQFTYCYGVILSLVPIALYNGEREKNVTSLKRKINKWFFYLYYPLHLGILSLLHFSV